MTVCPGHEHVGQLDDISWCSTCLQKKVTDVRAAIPRCRCSQAPTAHRHPLP